MDDGWVIQRKNKFRHFDVAARFDKHIGTESIYSLLTVIQSIQRYFPLATRQTTGEICFYFNPCELDWNFVFHRSLLWLFSRIASAGVVVFEMEKVGRDCIHEPMPLWFGMQINFNWVYPWHYSVRTRGEWDGKLISWRVCRANKVTVECL